MREEGSREEGTRQMAMIYGSCRDTNDSIQDPTRLSHKAGAMEGQRG